MTLGYFLQDEEPYYEEMMAEVNEKLKDLIELNRNKPIPSLFSTQKSIQCQLKAAATIGKNSFII